MKNGPKLLPSVQPSGILLVLDRDPALQGSVSRGVTVDCSRKRMYQPLSSQMNSDRVDDIIDDVEVCSWDTIILHNRESRQSKKNLYGIIDLLPWQDRNCPRLSVYFTSKAERKGRNENPDLFQSMFEKFLYPFPINSGRRGLLL